ncbi:hypothetical protein PR048_014307 [Dryococelus australis]|uniref:Uncharacterized protein n=1 Tax=Dryococelus australis TaxID=614101 RepID=A0ABQ9HDU5_9NEOP|nr:hypothetical protein PR048_014307 [Dryococelus australis]
MQKCIASLAVRSVIPSSRCSYMLQNDTALASLRVIVRALLIRDDIDVLVTVLISILVPWQSFIDFTCLHVAAAVYSSRIMHRVMDPSYPELYSGDLQRLLRATSFVQCESHQASMDLARRSIRTQDPARTNNRELRVAIQMAWVNITPQMLRPLVESMLRRDTALPTRGVAGRVGSCAVDCGGRGGKSEFPEKNPPMSGTIPTCENPGAAPASSPWWEAGARFAEPPRPRQSLRRTACLNTPSNIEPGLERDCSNHLAMAIVTLCAPSFVVGPQQREDNGNGYVRPSLTTPQKQPPATWVRWNGIFDSLQACHGVLGTCTMRMEAIHGATVAERLARPPPIKANRSRSPAASPDFRKWEILPDDAVGRRFFIPFYSGLSLTSEMPASPDGHHEDKRDRGGAVRTALDSRRGLPPHFRMWESCRTMPLVFSGISRFPRPFTPALLHAHLASTSPALKTSVLRAAQISTLHYIQGYESLKWPAVGWFVARGEMNKATGRAYDLTAGNSYLLLLKSCDGVGVGGGAVHCCDSEVSWAQQACALYHTPPVPRGRSWIGQRLGDGRMYSRCFRARCPPSRPVHFAVRRRPVASALFGPHLTLPARLPLEFHGLSTLLLPLGALFTRSTCPWDGGNGRSPSKPADQRHLTRPGIEPGSPWWEASVLIVQPPCPHEKYLNFHFPKCWGRLLAPHIGEPNSISGGVSPEISHAGIVPDDVAGRRVFSWISRFLPPLAFRNCSILTSLHSHRP